MSSSDAYTVLEAVYWHRLTGPDDTIQNLTARDPEVNQAYSTLLASAQLTTGGTDSTAVLHHLSLLRNQGTTGGFIAEGDQVTSVGIRRLPPDCLVNPGGFINGLPTNPFPCGTEPALVFLTVHGRNGQVFRYFTNAYTCGGRGTYGFHGVMSGSADLIVRPFRGCCQQGETTFQITCPPNPTMLLPCVPVQTNLLVSVTMGPPQPPGFFGQVVGPGAAGAHVWVANRDDACLETSSTTADANGGFTLPGCLPSGDVYVYASSSNSSAIGRTNVSDSLQCGQFEGPITIVLQPPPTVSGQIRPWSSSWFPHVGALAQGCASFSCSSGASLTVTAPGDQLLGRYSLQLKPGHWDLYSYRDLGSCVNRSGQTVPWICRLYHGPLDLEAGQALSIDLAAPPSSCPCPN
jgi:hypothetical protein